MMHAIAYSALSQCELVTTFGHHRLFKNQACLWSVPAVKAGLGTFVRHYPSHGFVTKSYRKQYNGGGRVRLSFILYQKSTTKSNFTSSPVQTAHLSCFISAHGALAHFQGHAPLRWIGAQATRTGTVLDDKVLICEVALSNEFEVVAEFLPFGVVGACWFDSTQTLWLVRQASFWNWMVH